MTNATRKFRDLPTADLTRYTEVIAAILDGEPAVKARDEFIEEFYDDGEWSQVGMAMWRHPLLHEMAFGDPLSFDLNGRSAVADMLRADSTSKVPDGEREKLAKANEAFNPYTRLNTKAAEVARHARKGSWNGIVMFTERPYRADVVLLLMPVLKDSMTTGELSEFIKGWWTDAEYPHQNHAWHALLKMVEYFDLPRPHFNDGTLPDGVDEVVAYRGVAVDPDDTDLVLDDLDGYIGRSWTTDAAQAKWFSERFARSGDKVPHVLRATVPTDAVLWATDSRGESELLVVPTMLRDVTVVDE